MKIFTLRTRKYGILSFLNNFGDLYCLAQNTVFDSSTDKGWFNFLFDILYDEQNNYLPKGVIQLKKISKKEMQLFFTKVYEMLPENTITDNNKYDWHSKFSKLLLSESSNLNYSKTDAMLSIPKTDLLDSITENTQELKLQTEETSKNNKAANRFNLATIIIASVGLLFTIATFVISLLSFLKQYN